MLSWTAWTKERQFKIAALNERVTKLTAQAIADNEGSKEPLSLEYVHAQKFMTPLVAGAPVYQMRAAWVVYLYCVFATLLVFYGLFQLVQGIGLAATIPTTALSLLIMFVGYDLYSGILHVVLDHPSNIALPVLGQPCLEFQWHHAIPDDLVRKDFVDVCGDLNVVILILAVVNLYLLDLDSGVAMVVGGFKLFMAYFGQFSHKSAHSFGSKTRAPLGDWLQTNGFMISAKEHMAHHKAPHDIDFCLIGLCNPIIDALRQVTTSNAVWLTTFLVWSIMDLYCYSHLVELVAKSMGWM